MESVALLLRFWSLEKTGYRSGTPSPAGGNASARRKYPQITDLVTPRNKILDTPCQPPKVGPFAVLGSLMRLCPASQPQGVGQSCYRTPITGRDNRVCHHAQVADGVRAGVVDPCYRVFHDSILAPVGFGMLRL